MKASLAFRFALALTLVFAQGTTFVRAQSVPQDELEISTFYVGEFDRPTFSFWGPRLACGFNIEEWAKVRCGGRRPIFKPVTDGVAGNRCGYRGFALICFNR